MPIQVIEGFDQFGGLARGLGALAGGYAGREIGKGILSRELGEVRKKFTDPKTGKLKEGTSMLDMLEGLTRATYGMPGGPEYMQSALPLLQAEIQRKDVADTLRSGAPSEEQVGPERMDQLRRVAALRNEEYVNNLPEEQRKALASPSALSTSQLMSRANIDPFSLQSKEGVEAALAKEITYSADEYSRKVSQVANALQVSRQEAGQLVDKDLEMQNAQLRSLLTQRARVSEVAEKTDKALDTRLKEAAIDEKQLGDVKPNIREIAHRLVAQGKAEEQAAAMAAQRAKEYVKARDTLTKKGTIPFFFEPTQKYLDSIKELRQTYEEVGALEQFKDQLMSTTKMGEHFASSIAFPLSDSLNEAIQSAPPMPGEKYVKGLKSGFLEGGPLIPFAIEKASKFMGKYEPWKEKMVDVLANKIDQNTSLKTLKLALYSVAPNDEVVDEIISEAMNKREQDPSDKQRRELSSLYSTPISSGNIGDLFAIFSLSDDKNAPYISRFFKGLFPKAAR